MNTSFIYNCFTLICHRRKKCAAALNKQYSTTPSVKARASSLARRFAGLGAKWSFILWLRIVQFRYRCREYWSRKQQMMKNIWISDVILLQKCKHYNKQKHDLNSYAERWYKWNRMKTRTRWFVDKRWSSGSWLHCTFIRCLGSETWKVMYRAALLWSAL